MTHGSMANLAFDVSDHDNGRHLRNEFCYFVGLVGGRMKGLLGRGSN
jgi:hypothetical protein